MISIMGLRFLDKEFKISIAIPNKKPKIETQKRLENGNQT